MDYGSLLAKDNERYYSERMSPLCVDVDEFDCVCLSVYVCVCLSLLDQAQQVVCYRQVLGGCGEV